MSSFGPWGVVPTPYAESSTTGLRRAGLILSFVILLLAFWAISRAAGTVVIADVLRSAQALPTTSLWLACLLMAVSYGLVTTFDFLAWRHLGRRVPYSQTALASFLASAFGNNLGFSVVTGASVRYRIYSHLGLSLVDIAAASLFCTATAVMGLMTVLAIRLLAGGAYIGDTVSRLPDYLRQPIGALILLSIIAYIAMASIKPTSVIIRGRPFQLPSSRTAMALVLVGTTNILVIGTLVYLLLPPINTTYLGYLGVFVLAMMGGGLSHVPGGIGVFESILLIGLPRASPAGVLGAALLFRCIYYLTPLSVATLLFAVHEMAIPRVRFPRPLATAMHWLREFGPQLMAVIVAFAGVVLMFTGTLHGMHTQHQLLQAHLPLWVVEVAHFTTSIIGLLLVVFGAALSQRSRFGYRAAVALLAIGICSSYLHTLRSLDALALLLAMALVVSSRQAFDRLTEWQTFRLPWEWVSTLIAVVIATVWLGIFNFHHMEFSNDLWLTFRFEGDYSRYLRSTLGLLSLTGFILLRSGQYTHAGRPTDLTIERALEIANRHSDTRGQLAQVKDNRLLFSGAQGAFLMYRVQRPYWICLGDPIGARSEVGELTAMFVRLAKAENAVPVFYLVDPVLLDLRRSNMQSLPIARAACTALPPRLTDILYWRARRNVKREAAALGVRVDILLPQQARASSAELCTVESAWSETRSTRPRIKGTDSYSAYLSTLLLTVVRQADDIVGFAYWRPSVSRGPLALERLRVHPGSKGILDDLIILEVLDYAIAQGYSGLHLGYARIEHAAQHASSDLQIKELSGQLFYKRYPADWSRLLRIDWCTKSLVFPSDANTSQLAEEIASVTAACYNH